MYTKVMTKINQVCKIRNPTEEFGFSILDWEILEFWIFDLDFGRLCIRSLFARLEFGLCNCCQGFGPYISRIAGHADPGRRIKGFTVHRVEMR